MSTKVTPVSVSPDAGFSFRTGGGSTPASEGRAAPRQEKADLRLIIEEDETSGSYVYRTIDRRTGEVVQQFPVESVLKLKRESDYEAGAVIKTTA